ncbi:MAG TPA: triose-phosphate isomerase, partial [Candidatus Paceibacterota bacterium]|nr:triose-phosphate isomerase [Candidatus Paceibacterota bacterium]
FLKAVAGYSAPEIYNNVAVAYEPLWAIGSKIDIDLNYVEKQISSLRNYLKSKTQDQLDILYGGSVNKINIKALLDLSVLSGVLIGERSSQKEWLEDFLQSMI